jgi:type IV secretion system protein VirB10
MSDRNPNPPSEEIVLASDPEPKLAPESARASESVRTPQSDPKSEGISQEPSDAAPDAMWRADRELPSINRSASVQGRITRVLGLVVFGTLAVGVLGWYYTQTATRASRESAAAAKVMRERATGESTVPPLGRVDPPVMVPVSDPAPTPEELAWWHQEAVDGDGHGSDDNGDDAEAVDQAGAAPGEAPWVERVLPRPVPPRSVAGPDADAGALNAAHPSTTSGMPPAYASFAASGSAYGVADPELARRLSGDVLMTAGASGGGAAMSVAVGAPAGDDAATDSLEARLQPTVIEAAQARLLPTRRMLLPKGAMLDCTLETAIDSSLPGLVTCVMAQPAYSADGRVVLFERGTKLIGEVGGQVRRGQRRLFVLWSEARTPTGVVVDLASPGTDALGRSGLTGDIDRHFGERFGAAILLSVIDGAIQAGVESSRQDDSSSVVVSPAASRDIVSEVLEDSIGIPPTITVAPGTRVRVLVARDLDFRSVYALERVAR